MIVRSICLGMRSCLKGFSQEQPVLYQLPGHQKTIEEWKRYRKRKDKRMKRYRSDGAVIGDLEQVAAVKRRAVFPAARQRIRILRRT